MEITANDRDSAIFKLERLEEERMAQTFLGIDVGTTNVKAAVFDPKGGLLAYHAVSTPIVHPIPEFSEFPAEKLWQCVCQCIQSVANQVGPETICAVGVSAMAEGGLLLDEQGNPLTDIIAWYDMRSVMQCDELEKKLSKDQIYRITGQAPSAKYGVTKLMWLVQNRKQQVKQAAHWLSVEDYVLFRLSGEYATDYSVASRTMAFDIHQLQWSDIIMEAAGIDKTLFPATYPGGTRIGSITKKAHEACGLIAGMPVCTGGHDHACAAMSVDILQDGICMDSMGTAEVSMMAFDKLLLTDEGQKMCYSVYPHCGKKLYRALTSNQSCGVCIEWALKLFGEGIEQEAAAKSMSKYDYFLSELTDGNGAYFLPFLRGTVEQAGVQGVFWNLSDNCTQKDLISALVDGLCFELKRQIEGYQKVFGTKAQHLRMVGGLSKSAPIMSRKSRIHHCKVSVPQNTEAACYGAAILGGLGAGILNWEDQHFVCGTEYEIAADSTDARRYERYLEIRQNALEGYERMGQL